MPDTFPDWEFTGHFKFRPQDFMRVLRALGLTCPDGCPIFLRIGDNAQCQSVVRSDWAFAVLVKRLATGGRYRDLQAVLGGSKTVLCNTFLYMLTFLYAASSTPIVTHFACMETAPTLRRIMLLRQRLGLFQT